MEAQRHARARMLTIEYPEQNKEGHANVIASEKLTLTVNSSFHRGRPEWEILMLQDAAWILVSTEVTGVLLTSYCFLISYS